MQGRDYRVKLDFAYIPKNAYEDKLFFEILLKCKTPISAPQLRDELLKKNRNGEDFWEERGRASSRATVEVIRDILDFAAYCGMIQKVYPFTKKRSKAVYVLNSRGEDISRRFLIKDKSVQKDLIHCLMNYKIANNQLDFETYIEFKSFRVRPFFVLLKVLYEFQNKYPNISLDVDPYDLGFVILSVKNEDDGSIEDAVVRLYNLVTKRKSLEEYLKMQDSNRTEFSKKTNNCITRLFRWPYCCGLIECKTTSQAPKDFFEKWEGIRISRILGLSTLGKLVLKELINTYYYWENNLHSSEIIIIEILKALKHSINKEDIYEILEKENIITRVRYERQIARLKSIINLNEKNREISLSKIPIFDSINKSILQKANHLLQLIEPKAKPLEIEEPLSIEISLEETSKTYDFVKFHQLLSEQSIEEYSNMGLDRYFFDYWPLAIGESRLKERYPDIRKMFETKTAMLFKQMNFSVTSFGQETRGKSAIDVLANWSRVSETTNQRKDNITVIECKSSKEPYNLSLKDIDDRVRQINNLIESKSYKPVRTLINSLLFVSSSFGTGDNESKMEQIEEKVLRDLNLQIKIGLIGAKQLLYLNTKYKRAPQKFEEYDFKNLFKNKEITHVDINKIFQES